jgi:hypothetical protein
VTGIPRVPATARARIERAAVDAERLLLDVTEQHTEGEGPDVDRALVPTTVALLGTIVEALSEAARRYAWTAYRLRVTVDHCAEETTGRLFPYRSDQVFQLGYRIEEFRQNVLSAARRAAWWPVYLDALEERSVAAIPFHLHLRAVLDEIGWTRDQCATLTGINRTNVYDHTDGVSLPSAETLAKYEAACSAELGWPCGFSLPPKPTRTTKTPRKRHFPRR